MKKFGNFVVKYRIIISIISLILLIPSGIGYFSTRINYDMLSYLPDNIATIEGQNILVDEFGKGAFTCVYAEGLTSAQIQDVTKKIEDVDHVVKVMSYDSITEGTIPKEMLPEDISSKLVNDNGEMIVVFLDTSTSAQETLDAIEDIRNVDTENLYVSGASAMVVDLKNLCDKQVPIYVSLAVILALIAMLLTLDNWIVPFIFMASIGVAVVYNMGTNVFMGQISFITMCLAAILQLAVTLDYSIFLWHSYEEEKETHENHKEAMATAINKTLLSIAGSSTTTIAGFIALCFMTYRLGLDLGIVMTKGVVLGVIGCVTVLPSYLLLFDAKLEKFNHKCFIPSMDGVVNFVVKHYKPIIVAFLIVLIPAVIGRKNVNIYYDLSSKLSVDAGLSAEDVPYSVANNKLAEDFGVGNMALLLYDTDLDSKDARAMMEEMQDVEGVSYILGQDALLDGSIPQEFIPSTIKEELESDKHKLAVINSEYANGSDESNAQIDQLTDIVNKYDKSACLIGEAEMSHDLVSITNKDFEVVNTISIIAIFLIIFFVTKSITLPLILVGVIEFAIFLNIGTSFFMGTTIAFIAPICISTIQLGACVDYGILMTNRYKTERKKQKSRKEAVQIALETSIPSIIVSALGLFAATIGVTIYSNIDIISGICTLMARGAIISMISVILLLPSLLLAFDKVICKTTRDMKNVVKN